MENDKTSVANDSGPGLSPGPWRITGAPNYRNVVDANGRPVCAVVGGVNGEVNARVLAEAHRAAHAACGALRVIGELANGGRPAVGEVDRVMDELGAVAVAVFGTNPREQVNAEPVTNAGATTSTPARRGRGKSKRTNDPDSQPAV